MRDYYQGCHVLYSLCQLVKKKIFKYYFLSIFFSFSFSSSFFSSFSSSSFFCNALESSKYFSTCKMFPLPAKNATVKPNPYPALSSLEFRLARPFSWVSCWLFMACSWESCWLFMVCCWFMTVCSCAVKLCCIKRLALAITTQVNSTPPNERASFSNCGEGDSGLSSNIARSLLVFSLLIEGQHLRI